MIQVWVGILASISLLHDFHVSITYAELNAATNSLEISMKVFTDDLEAALAEDCGFNPNLGEPDQLAVSDSLIFSYISRHFSLSTGEQNLELQFIGKEYEQDITFIYMIVPEIGELNQVKVSNTLFFNRFEDQSNIVNIEVQGRIKSAFLESGNPEESLNFD